ncbi:hypothetical protein [Tenacibaculum maritimum]|uniref:hypothetical protein n=1 Tax=Tenacibaculum maritimum TaxID=107401 RepID=UPI003875D16D
MNNKELKINIIRSALDDVAILDALNKKEKKEMVHDIYNTLCTYPFSSPKNLDDCYMSIARKFIYLIVYGFSKKATSSNLKKAIKCIEYAHSLLS